MFVLACDVADRAMKDVPRLIPGVELEGRTAALLAAAAACGVGALVVLVHKVSSHQKTTEKIQRARKRRTESLERAEQAVLRYRDAVSQTVAAPSPTVGSRQTQVSLRPG